MGAYPLLEPCNCSSVPTEVAIIVIRRMVVVFIFLSLIHGLSLDGMVKDNATPTCNMTTMLTLQHR